MENGPKSHNISNSIHTQIITVLYYKGLSFSPLKNLLQRLNDVHFIKHLAFPQLTMLWHVTDASHLVNNYI